MKRRKKQMTVTHVYWHRLMIILLFGNIVAGIAFSEVMPFLPLFLQHLGDYSTKEINFYSAVIFSSTYLVAMVFSPLWGKIGDRFGRKPILLLSAGGSAIVIGILFFITNIWELIGLRALQGLFAGYFSNTNALLAAEVPSEKSGYALGTLATGFTAGSLLGPLLGGTISSLFGYRLTFLITGTFLIIVFFMNYIGIDGTWHHSTKDDHPSIQPTLLNVSPEKKIIIRLYIVSLLIQIGNNAINPILSLYVVQLMHNTGNINLMNGIAASVPGVTCLAASSWLGRLGDRIGTENVLKAGLLASSCFLLPMAFVTNVWQFILLQSCIGLSDAALIPAVQILLAKHTPAAISSSIFGYNQSFQSAGIVIGPFLGSFTANLFGYRGIFIGTALLFGALIAMNKTARHQRA